MLLGKPFHQDTPWNYLYPVVLTGLALLLHLQLAPLLGPNTMLSPFLLSVMLSAYGGGLGPGLLAGGLSLLALHQFFLPLGSADADDANWLRLLSFTLMSLLVVWFGQRLRHVLRTSEAERAEQTFLGQVSAVLAETLDLQVALRRLAQLATHHFADWCLVTQLGPDPARPVLIMASRDAGHTAWLQHLEQNYRLDPAGRYGSGQAIASGRPVLIEHFTDQDLASFVSDPELLSLFRQMRVHSYLSVPLTARGRVIGAIAFGRSQGHGHFQGKDLALAEEVARRSALAIDNILLYREAREAEAAQRQSEERFRAIFEHAPVGMVQADSQGRWLQVNDKLCQILGYSQAELLGKPFQALTHPEDLSGDLDCLQQLNSGRIDSYSREKRYRRQDGSYIWTRLTLSVVRDPTGEPRYRIGVIEDVSERKQAEAALRESEARFRAIFEQAAVGLGQSAPGGRVLNINQRLCDMLGSSREELLQKTFMDFTHPDDLKKELPLRQQLLSGAIPAYTLEKRYIRADGSHVWANITASLVRDAVGRPAYTISVVEDITARKRAEALIDCEKRILEMIVKEVPLLSVLDSLVRIFERQADKPLTCSIMLLEPDGRDLRMAAAPNLPEPLVRAMERMPLAVTDHPCAAAAQRQELVVADIATDPRWGSFRELALAHGLHTCWAQPILSARGQLLGVLSVYSPRTERPDAHALDMLQWTTNLAEIVVERRRAEAEARSLNVELERRVAERTAALLATNQELEAFSYSVSHDLRAPLRGIDGFSYALLEDCGTLLSSECRDYLRRIRQASQRMGELIDALLNLARLSRGELRREPVDLGVLAREIAESLQRSEPERQVAWVFGEGLRTAGDPQLLRAVLDNLLGNAWKFTGKQADARIEFGMAEEGGQRVFFVRDNGAGFDMSYADKLFQPFQRLHSPGEFAGTGVGLAIVQRIIRRHGGRIWAEGAVGQGATFYFTLGGAGS
ncbi:MAG: PAS domain S-box protein [Pseudomonadota bacterium]